MKRERRISRDILGWLKSLGVIAPGPRAPQIGAPIAWVTTQRFLEMIALGSLRDLPDLKTAPAASRRERDNEVEAALKDALGVIEEGFEDDAREEGEVEARRRATVSFSCRN